MSKRILSLLVAAAVASTAACNNDAGDGDVVAQDTAVSTFPSADTVDLPTVVPTQDTVIETTTVTQDTVRGDARVDGDTVRRP